MVGFFSPLMRLSALFQKMVTERKQIVAFLLINSVQPAVDLHRLQKQAESSPEVQDGEEVQSPAPGEEQPTPLHHSVPNQPGQKCVRRFKTKFSTARRKSSRDASLGRQKLSQRLSFVAPLGSSRLIGQDCWSGVFLWGCHTLVITVLPLKSYTAF